MIFTRKVKPYSSIPSRPGLSAGRPKNHLTMGRPFPLNCLGLIWGVYHPSIPKLFLQKRESATGFETIS